MFPFLVVFGNYIHSFRVFLNFPRIFLEWNLSLQLIGIFWFIEGLTLYSPDGSIRASVALIAAQFAQKKLSVISEMDANAPFIINKVPPNYFSSFQL